MKYPVGYSWQGERNERTIVNVMPHPHTGLPVYVVQSPGQPFSNIIPEDRIDAEIALDARLHAQALKKLIANEESRRIAQEREIQQAEHDSWFGFTDNFSPLKRGKILATLGKHMTLNDGAIEERGNVIAILVQEGRRIEYRGGVRYLVSDDGRYLSEKDLTKTGMDFAEYLLHR